MSTYLLQDLKYAIRNLSRTPGFVAVVCGVLALGIGANTALFTVVDKVLIQPLPFEESNRLMEIQESPGGQGSISVSYPNYKDWVKRSRSFETLAFAAVAERVLPGEGGSRRIPVGYVSANFFEAYRVKAAIGRMFTAAEDVPGATPVAVLSKGFWLGQFGGDPAILGKSIRIDDQMFTVIGVLPEFPYYRPAKLYVPVVHGVAVMGFAQRENHNSSAVTGRLNPGVTVVQARTEMTQIAAGLEREYPGSNRGISITLVPQHEYVSGWARKTILVLFGAVAFLLLLTCVNVANMMLSRATSRTKEMSIRAALGASQGRIGRQLLTESVLLGVGGAVLGLLVARLGVPILARMAPNTMAEGLTQPNWTVFVFTALAGILSGVLSGAAPALQSMRVDVNRVLREGGRQSSHAGHPRLRNALVVVQVSIALVLLSGAGLMVRSLHKLMNEDPGFRTSGVLMMKISLPGAEAQMARTPHRFGAILARVQALPGVQSAGGVSVTPMSGENSNANIGPEGYEMPANGGMPAADYRATSPEYFPTVGIPLLKGRMYSKADGVMPQIESKDLLTWFRSTSISVVVNQEMAQRFWPGKEVLGKRFRFGPPSFQGPWMTVVGVVGSVRQHGLDEAPAPTFFFSSWMLPWPENTVVVRTQGNPADVAASVRRAVLEVESAAVISDAKTFDDLIQDNTASRRSNIRLMGLFAALALVLAGLGIYGVIAYSVGQRRQEFGIRMALGATPGVVMNSVLGQGLKLVLAGVLIGLAASAGLARLVASMLYGVQTTDPITYGAVVATLLAAGLAAAALPAMRATRVDPSTALRAD